MSLFVGILIFMIAYLVIGGVVLGYQHAKSKGNLDDAEFLLCLVGWPMLILYRVVIAIITVPAKFGKWLYAKIEAMKK